MVELQFLKTFSISSISKNLKSTFVELQLLKTFSISSISKNLKFTLVELRFLKTFSISIISKTLKSTLVELQFLPQDAISFPPGGCLAFCRFYQSSLFCSIRCFKHLKYSIVFVVPIRSFKYISDTPEKCWLNSSLARCVLVLHTQSNMVCLANKL